VSWTVKGRTDTGTCYFFNTLLYFAWNLELPQGLNNPQHTHQ